MSIGGVNIVAEPGDFICSIGQDNGRALREGGFRLPREGEPEDAESLASRFEELAAGHEPSHGNYFPHTGEAPDLHFVARALAVACRRRAGRRLFVRGAA